MSPQSYFTRAKDSGAKLIGNLNWQPFASGKFLIQILTKLKQRARHHKKTRCTRQQVFVFCANKPTLQSPGVSMLNYDGVFIQTGKLRRCKRQGADHTIEKLHFERADFSIYLDQV